MRALSIRQPYAELRRAGDQDGGTAVDVDDDRGGTLLYLRVQSEGEAADLVG
jgi:hypothetical protein